MISATEEDYIKAIYSIANQANKEYISTNDIASRLSTSAPSVTDMFRKLSKKNLVNYEKYKGVKLSNIGESKAINLLRKHRLWESFLCEKLGFGWDEVHDIAEQLEHIRSDELVQRLDTYLGYPKFDPHGDPIPDGQGTFTARQQWLLSSMDVGDTAVLIGVKKHDADFLQHLNKLHIQLGCNIHITEIYNYDHSIRVMLNGTKEALLAQSISEYLYMKN